MAKIISDSAVNFLLVMLGGGLGSMCRYGTSMLAASFFKTRFPYGTLIVNLSGCFLIGVCFALAERAAWFGTSARLFFMTGFLGGLTTFSTYALETVIYERKGFEIIAIINFLANNIGGMALVLAGMQAVRLILKEKL